MSLEQLGLKRRGGNKFNAQGVRDPEFGYFHSKGEHRRWHALRLLEKAGEILNLERQVKFTFAHNDVEITSFKADFAYFTANERVIEDWKGGEATKTDAYKIKRNLMRAFYGITIKETGP